jgi:hypothetical protein
VITDKITGQPGVASQGKPLKTERLMAPSESIGERVGLSLRVAKLARAGRPAATAA